MSAWNDNYNKSFGTRCRNLFRQQDRLWTWSDGRLWARVRHLLFIKWKIDPQVTTLEPTMSAWNDNYNNSVGTRCYNLFWQHFICVFAEIHENPRTFSYELGKGHYNFYPVKRYCLLTTLWQQKFQKKCCGHFAIFGRFGEAGGPHPREKISPYLFCIISDSQNP